VVVVVVPPTAAKGQGHVAELETKGGGEDGVPERCGGFDYGGQQGNACISSIDQQPTRSYIILVSI
jgi:hypothetical protein